MAQTLSNMKTTNSLAARVLKAGVTAPADTTAPAYTHASSDTQSPTNGTAANQVDLAHFVTEVVTDTNSLDVDLTLDTDLNGIALAMVTMKYLEVVSDQDVVITSTIPFLLLGTDAITVKAGGMMILQDFSAGYAITATTGDAITVTNNSGQTANISVRVLGTSA